MFYSFFNTLFKSKKVKMKNLIFSIGMIGVCLLLSKLIGQECNLNTRHYLDYFASHLMMTQQKLHGQDNHATVAAFEENLDKNCFIKSLENVFQAHPNLRIKKIKFDDNKKLFYVDEELKFSDINCKFIDINNEESWKDILEKELSTPFSADGPYWKIYCLTLKNSKKNLNFLIQFFNHSLSDGISTAKLNDELFTYYDVLKKGKNIEIVKDNKIDSLALLVNKDQQCLWDDYKNKQNKLAKLYPIPDGNLYEKETSIENRKTKSVLFSFELEKISQFCKANDITVNDLLVATNLMALWKNETSLSNKKSLNTSVLTCVNLRNPNFGLVNVINKNNLACLFNIVTLPMKIDNTSTILSVAKSYSKLSKTYINVLAVPPVDFSIDNMCDRYGINLAKSRNYFAGGIATSNLGKLDLKKKYGDVDIIFYQFFTNQGAGFFEALLDVSCVENTIFCNITYVEPLHRRSWAIGLASNFISELEVVLQKKLLLVERATDKDLNSIFCK